MTRKLTFTTILAMAALVLAVPAIGSPDTDELISVGLSGPQYAPDAFERAVAAEQLRQTSLPRYSDSATTAMVVDKQSSSPARYSDSATSSIEHAVLAREQAQREVARAQVSSDSAQGALWASTSPDVTTPVAQTSATGSGSDIEWPQLGFGLGLGILLGFGVFLAMRFIRIRPLAH